MKINGKDISTLWDDELLAIHRQHQDMEAKRLKASTHEKFKKMEFPSPNPAFVELKNAIINEIKNRKLMDI